MYFKSRISTFFFPLFFSLFFENSISLCFSSFERAWFATGAEDRGGAPYLTRSALYEWALVNGLKNKKYTKDSLRAQIPADGNKGKYIGPLIEEKLIEVHENGWIVIDPGTASGMMLKK